jgi:hypothetical protein
MAFVHCDSCPWSQDDFWNRKYNPVRFFLKYELPSWILPRFVGYDPVCHSRLSLRTGLSKIVEVPYKPEEEEPLCYAPETPRPATIRHHYVFSWLILARCIGKWAHRIRTQVWWTNESWKKAIASNAGLWPLCPKCGADALDID